jgi:hypothetical protein
MRKISDWLTIRADRELRKRLMDWQKKNRRPNTSEAVRIIIEDRLDADQSK